MPDKDGFLSDKEIYDSAKEEWVNIIREMWFVIDKPIEEKRLNIYIRELSNIPLGLLERAIRRCIREARFSIIPTVGEIWSAVFNELGRPYDVNLAIEQYKINPLSFS